MLESFWHKSPEFVYTRCKLSISRQTGLFQARVALSSLLYSLAGWVYLVDSRVIFFLGSVSGGVAQLARAPALQAGGPGFESPCLHLFFEILCIWFDSEPM